MFSLDSTLKEVKAFLRAGFTKGVDCPACGQHVQQYEYKLFATSAFALIELYKLDQRSPNGSGDFFHIKDYAEASGNRLRAPHFAELRFWGLVVKAPNDDPKKKASGYWAITQKGREFVRGLIPVPSRILVFNNKFCGFSDKAVDIKINEALGNDFNFEEVMGEDFISHIRKKEV